MLASLLKGVAIAAAAFFLTSPADAHSIRDRVKERMEQRRGDSADNLREAAIEHGGVRRTYLVHVPRSIALSNAPAPLVLAFHGGGGDAGYMADDSRYGLISKSDAAGFIVVFPSGFSKLPGGKFATWNAGNCCGDARDREIDDVGFARALVKRLQATHKIDPKRVYATGMSNGGMMSHRLACEAADIFAAVASVAGTDNMKSCNPSRPISVLHIHAKNDTHVLFDGGAGKDAFRDPSKVTEFTSVAETINRWSKRDQCDAQAVKTVDKVGAYCEARSCSGQSTVALCVTDTGGHSWPGADVTRSGKEGPSQALEANDVIWDFFKDRRLP